LGFAAIAVVEKAASASVPTTRTDSAHLRDFDRLTLMKCFLLTLRPQTREWDPIPGLL
jgi:hypothetical protein